jgi:hypothetical protein
MFHNIVIFIVASMSLLKNFTKYYTLELNLRPLGTEAQEWCLAVAQYNFESHCKLIRSPEEAVIGPKLGWKCL